ncbi:MAG: polyprenyl synthetase family protein [Rickettsiales bacterium]|nr:polyprenyl synthetase family protein [Rickettsiales bacterium]
MTATATNAPQELAHTRALVAGDIGRVNELIIAYAESDIPLIGQMIRHVVLSGGKRLRPALTLLSARMMGYNTDGTRHIALASAVEFIHTATLLHDDVVDESALRRGEDTANEVWGNSASVLVGDYLLSRAFQLMVSDGSLKVLKILSDASAIIAQGEVLQLTTANVLETTMEQYLEVIIGKTATLFAAACELGAVVTERDEWEAPLRSFGMNLGIAFQMMDDALDYSAKQEALGKSIGDDFRDGKITLPVIHAFANGTDEEKAFWERTMGEQEQEEADLMTALKLLRKYDAVEHTVNVARQYCDKALQEIAALPQSEEKQALLEITDFCIKRAY